MSVVDSQVSSLDGLTRAELEEKLKAAELRLERIKLQSMEDERKRKLIRAEWENKRVEQETERRKKQRKLERETLLKAAFLAERRRKSGRHSDKNDLVDKKKAIEEYWNEYRVICELESGRKLKEISLQSRRELEFETKFNVASREAMVSVTTVLAEGKLMQSPLVADVSSAETGDVKTECDDEENQNSENGTSGDHTEIGEEQLQGDERDENVVEIVSEGDLEKIPVLICMSIDSGNKEISILVEEEEMFVGKNELQPDDVTSLIHESAVDKLDGESNSVCGGAYSCDVEIEMNIVKQRSPKSGYDCSMVKDCEVFAREGLRFSFLTPVACSEVEEKFVSNDNDKLVGVSRINSGNRKNSEIGKNLIDAIKLGYFDYTCGVGNPYILIKSINMCELERFTSNVSNWRYKRKGYG